MFQSYNILLQNINVIYIERCLSFLKEFLHEEHKLGE